MEALFNWIANLPAVFWGVLAGPFTLVGVWLTNRAHAKRLERQFQHERLLKIEDREFALKRDVYLDAAEAVSAGVAVIGRLPDLSIAQERVLDDWVRRSPAIARATLVANDQTLDALTRFQANLTSAIVALLGMRTQLTLKVAERQSLLDEVSRLSAEGERLVRLLEMNAGGTTDDRKRAAVRSDFERGQERVTALLEKHQELNLEVFEEHMRFGRLCNEAVTEVSALLIPLIAAARTELRLPFDADAYARITKEAQGSISAKLEGLMIDMRTMIRDSEPPSTP